MREILTQMKFWFSSISARNQKENIIQLIRDFLILVFPSSCFSENVLEKKKFRRKETSFC